jgi:L-threonylcarbamoyladenylate synthase
LRNFAEKLARQVEEGIRILKEGGVIAYPTDTVYGLGASIYVPEAVKRVFVVKSRPRHMSMPVLVGDVAQIQDLAGTIPPAGRCLIDAFLPGALTLVLSASARVPVHIRSKEGTIALRVPNHQVPLALIEGIGAGLVGTSANLSGSPSPLSAEDVRRQLGGSVDLVIDGGLCPGTESTIVDVTGELPVILRAGAISAKEIERVCGEITAGNGVRK